jgi:hypothetical protein
MSEPTDRKVTRPAIEQLLLELSGFKADAADIAATMAVIDAYMNDQFIALNHAPSSLVESQQHLLMQQAELLLDSRGLVTALRASFEEHIRESHAPRFELTDTERAAVTAILETPEPEAPAEPEPVVVLVSLEAGEEEEPEVLGIRYDPVTGTEVACLTCGQWKTTGHYYKNSKSRTGYETKCRECRPPKVKAA